MNKTAIADAVAALNIQLDNLCQFLPQDRVVEFAKMTPTELLLETEKAFGARELYEAHTELITAKGAMRDLEASVGATEEQLARLRGINTSLERDVERFNARAELLAKAEVMRGKLPWLRYEEVRDELEKAKARAAEAKAALADAEKSLNEFTAPLKAKEAALAKCTEQLGELMKQGKASEAEFTKGNDALEHLVGTIQNCEADIEACRRTAAARAARIAKLERELEQAKADVAKLPASFDRGGELEDIKMQIRGAQKALREAEAEVEDAKEELRVPQSEASTLQSKLRALDDLRAQRIASLKQRPADRHLDAAAAAAARLRAAGRFRMEVYGPVLCEVSVGDKLHAAYLEQQCPRYLWSSFVTQCSEDQKLLEEECKALNIAITNRPPREGEPDAFPVPQALRQLGVTTSLHASFSAPPAVKAVMNDTCKLSEAFVSSDDKADALIAAGVENLWTPSNQYLTTKSRHADARSTRLVPTRDSRLFTSNANPALRSSWTARLVRSCRCVWQARKLC